VISNVAPKETGELINSALKGDYKKAKEMHYKLFALSKILFIETSPSPVKAAMNMMGLPREPKAPPCPSEKRKRRKNKENP